MQKTEVTQTKLRTFKIKVCFYGRKWRDDTIHKIRIRCYVFF